MTELYSVPSVRTLHCCSSSVQWRVSCSQWEMPATYRSLWHSSFDNWRAAVTQLGFLQHNNTLHWTQSGCSDETETQVKYMRTMETHLASY